MEHFLSTIPDSAEVLNGIFMGLGILCAFSLIVTASFILVGRRL